MAKEPRAYADVLDAWRTSCPRLTVWEEAGERGFVERTSRPEGGVVIIATAAGRDFVRQCNRERAAV